MVDALVSLFCRSNISAETLWDGGWLLRQLLPYSEAEFSSHHRKLLKVSTLSEKKPYTNKSCAKIFIMFIMDSWDLCVDTVTCTICELNLESE